MSGDGARLSDGRTEIEDQRPNFMKRYQVNLAVCILILGLSGAAFAGAGGKGKGKGAGATASEEKGPANSGAKSGDSPADVKVVISSSEREIIRNYVTSRTVAARPGAKPKGLPPGLAKKVARGGELPPGWQKKCVRGEIMPKEIFKLCEPLPGEVIVKLPGPPPGTIMVAIDGKVVRLARATFEILDVFDVL